MEQDLLRYLLAAFPTDIRNTAAACPPDHAVDDDHLVIRGYRVPFESPVDSVMLGVLAEFRRNGFSRDIAAGIDPG